MLLPDVQTRLEAFGARGWQIGGVFTAYFLVQMLCSPAWGQLSDRVGRKPILIACGVLSAGSMLAYALAHGLWWVMASRILAGFGGANVVVAQAYLADATDEPNRASAMGRMGAATTGGLILGPALGGWLAAQGGNVLVGGVAASASAVGALWIWLSVPRDARPQNKDKQRQGFFDLSLLRDTPAIRAFVRRGGSGVLCAGVPGRNVRTPDSAQVGIWPERVWLDLRVRSPPERCDSGRAARQDFASHRAAFAAAPGLRAARRWVGADAVHAQLAHAFRGQHPVCHRHGLCQPNPQHLMQRGYAAGATGRNVRAGCNPRGHSVSWSALCWAARCSTGGPKPPICWRALCPLLSPLSLPEA